jgi:hypothetical protein
MKLYSFSLPKCFVQEWLMGKVWMSIMMPTCTHSHGHLCESNNVTEMSLQWHRDVAATSPHCLVSCSDLQLVKEMSWRQLLKRLFRYWQNKFSWHHCNWRRHRGDVVAMSQIKSSLCTLKTTKHFGDLVSHMKMSPQPTETYTAN